jgi:hypothetical protein
MDTVTAPKRRGRQPKVSKLQEVAKTIENEQKAQEHALEDVFEPAVEPAAAPAPDLYARSRPEMRPAMREEDPRARAARRAAELRDHLGEEADGTDEFYIDPSDVPEGWDYEWKAKYVLGQEQATHILALRRAGWEEVPTHRHPSYMPMGTDMAYIERKGMVLMERPKEITEDARNRELRKARQQVRQKEEQLNAASGGQFDRNNKDQSLVNIKKSYESIPVPKN